MTFLHISNPISYSLCQSSRCYESWLTVKIFFVKGKLMQFLCLSTPPTSKIRGLFSKYLQIKGTVNKSYLYGKCEVITVYCSTETKGMKIFTNLNLELFKEKIHF